MHDIEWLRAEVAYRTDKVHRGIAPSSLTEPTDERDGIAWRALVRRARPTLRRLHLA